MKSRLAREGTRGDCLGVRGALILFNETERVPRGALNETSVNGDGRGDLVWQITAGALPLNWELQP
jgi:hypothetical protein